MTYLIAMINLLNKNFHGVGATTAAAHAAIHVANAALHLARAGTKAI